VGISGNGLQGLDSVRLRSKALRLAAIALSLIIVVRLGWLQLARGAFYEDLSTDNYVQGFIVRAPRGLILDRSGEILADNRAALSVTLNRTRGRDDEATADLLAELLDLDRAFVADKLLEARTSYYGSIVLLDDADFEQVSRVEEHRSELPGVKVSVTAVRRYPEGALGTHALGYVSEVSDVELRSMEPLGYSQGDIVGKTGVEKRYELLMRGRDGAEYWVFDASGRELYPFPPGPAREARPGNNLVLTIDGPAQRAAEAALAEFEAGSVVAIEPTTGEVLVLASHPSPDPNSLVSGVSSEEWSELVGSPRHPLLNRAVQATYPPGSPFKLFTAAAGIEENEVAPRRERVNCKGAYKYGIRTFRCWRPEGHGIADLMKGIVESCDVFFYQLGARLGVATLMDWTEKSGLGRKTGIDISGETGGNVPTPAWYDRRYGRRKWSKGVVLNLAIGQGELLVTPLQAAYVTAGIVNGGRMHTPHLFKSVETYSGRVIGTARPAASQELPYRASTIAFIRRAMVNVVEAPNGTGKQARVPGIEVGGKTGTAQNPHGEDHAWFVSFAPADDPKIALAVLVENAGSGGANAAPIAREVIRAYLRIEDPEPEPELLPVGGGDETITAGEDATFGGAPDDVVGEGGD
jgi:penicillin-binding protein 2